MVAAGFFVVYAGLFGLCVLLAKICIKNSENGKPGW